MYNTREELKKVYDKLEDGAYKDKVLFVLVKGSYVFNLQTENSDLDFLAVLKPTKESVLMNVQDKGVLLDYPETKGLVNVVSFKSFFKTVKRASPDSLGLFREDMCYSPFLKVNSLLSKFKLDKRELLSNLSYMYLCNKEDVKEKMRKTLVRNDMLVRKLFSSNSSFVFSKEEASFYHTQNFLSYSFLEDEIYKEKTKGNRVSLSKEGELNRDLFFEILVLILNKEEEK